MADSTFVSGLMSMSEACRFVGGRHPNTLRKYSNSGELPCYRRPNSPRYYRREDLAEFFGIKNTMENCSDEGAIFGYARVSSTGQAKGLNKGEENSLTRQIDEIQEHIRVNYSIESPPIYSDVASSLNWSRPGLTKMIRAILAGKHDNGTMIITFKDRLCRIGAEIIFLIAEIHNIQVLILNKNERQSSVIEMAEDVSAFVSLMANRMMAARGAKVLKKHITDETRVRIHELRSEGLSIAEVSRVIFSEGHKATNSKGETVIGPDVIRKTLNEKLQLATNETTVERYYRDCIEPANEDCRIEKKLLYENYANWSKARGSKPASMNMVGRILKNLQVKESNVHVGPNVSTAWAGIKIKDSSLHVMVSTRGNYKPQKRSIEKQNHFLEFAQLLINEGAELTRGQLNERYLAHCEQQSIKPIKLRLIPDILASEFKIVAQLTGKSHRYCFGSQIDKLSTSEQSKENDGADSTAIPFQLPPNSDSNTPQLSLDSGAIDSGRDSSEIAPNTSLLPVVNAATAAKSSLGSDCKKMACWKS